MTITGISFREGSIADLQETFAISERTVYEAAASQGILPPGRPPTDAQVRGEWRRQRALIEFLAAQPGGRYEICEDGGEAVGYARVVRFADVEELTELMVRPDRQGEGIGRGLLERCWPNDQSGKTTRLVVAAGAPADLSLYTAFGVAPVAGHWHMRLETRRHLEARAVERDDEAGAGAHVLEPDHAMAEWAGLEEAAIGHSRPELHAFFARDRTCLGCLENDGRANALCWVSGEGDIGPAVGTSARSLEPVVLEALDRVARLQEPEHLGVFVTTEAHHLLARLRGLGFRVWWPSWILSSAPVPGLDRYAPTRPPHVL